MKRGYTPSVVPPPELVFTPVEIGVFLLANAIIAFFCAPRLFLDVKRWRS